MEKNQPRIAKLFKTALLGLATVVLATACNKTTEPPIRPDETAKYNISGQVLGNNLENSDLTALAGVTVSYKFGSVSDETTTDANGYFSFEGLVSAGRYDLTFWAGTTRPITVSSSRRCAARSSIINSRSRWSSFRRV